MSEHQYKEQLFREEYRNYLVLKNWIQIEDCWESERQPSRGAHEAKNTWVGCVIEIRTPGPKYGKVKTQESWIGNVVFLTDQGRLETKTFSVRELIHFLKWHRKL